MATLESLMDGLSGIPKGAVSQWAKRAAAALENQEPILFVYFQVEREMDDKRLVELLLLDLPAGATKGRKKLEAMAKKDVYFKKIIKQAHELYGKENCTALFGVFAPLTNRSAALVPTETNKIKPGEFKRQLKQHPDNRIKKLVKASTVLRWKALKRLLGGADEAMDEEEEQELQAEWEEALADLLAQLDDDPELAADPVALEEAKQALSGLQENAGALEASLGMLSEAFESAKDLDEELPSAESAIQRNSGLFKRATYKASIFDDQTELTARFQEQEWFDRIRAFESQLAPLVKEFKLFLSLEIPTAELYTAMKYAEEDVPAFDREKRMLNALLRESTKRDEAKAVYTKLAGSGKKSWMAKVLREFQSKQPVWASQVALFRSILAELEQIGSELQPQVAELKALQVRLETQKAELPGADWTRLAEIEGGLGEALASAGQLRGAVKARVADQDRLQWDRLGATEGSAGHEEYARKHTANAVLDLDAYQALENIQILVGEISQGMTARRGALLEPKKDACLQSLAASADQLDAKITETRAYGNPAHAAGGLGGFQNALGQIARCEKQFARLVSDAGTERDAFVHPAEGLMADTKDGEFAARVKSAVDEVDAAYKAATGRASDFVKAKIETLKAIAANSLDGAPGSGLDDIFDGASKFAELEQLHQRVDKFVPEFLRYQQTGLSVEGFAELIYQVDERREDGWYGFPTQLQALKDKYDQLRVDFWVKDNAVDLRPDLQGLGPRSPAVAVLIEGWETLDQYLQKLLAGFQEGQKIWTKRQRALDKEMAHYDSFRQALMEASQSHTDARLGLDRLLQTVSSQEAPSPADADQVDEVTAPAEDLIRQVLQERAALDKRIVRVPEDLQRATAFKAIEGATAVLETWLAELELKKQTTRSSILELLVDDLESKLGDRVATLMGLLDRRTTLVGDLHTLNAYLTSVEDDQAMPLPPHKDWKSLDDIRDKIDEYSQANGKISTDAQEQITQSKSTVDDARNIVSNHANLIGRLGMAFQQLVGTLTQISDLNPTAIARIAEAKRLLTQKEVSRAPGATQAAVFAAKLRELVVQLESLENKFSGGMGIHAGLKMNLEFPDTGKNAARNLNSLRSRLTAASTDLDVAREQMQQFRTTFGHLLQITELPDSELKPPSEYEEAIATHLDQLTAVAAECETLYERIALVHKDAARRQQLDSGEAPLDVGLLVEAKVKLDAVVAFFDGLEGGFSHWAALPFPDDGDPKRAVTIQLAHDTNDAFLALARVESESAEAVDLRAEPVDNSAEAKEARRLERVEAVYQLATRCSQRLQGVEGFSLLPGSYKGGDSLEEALGRVKGFKKLNKALGLLDEKRRAARDARVIDTLAWQEFEEAVNAVRDWVAPSAPMMAGFAAPPDAVVQLREKLREYELSVSAVKSQALMIKGTLESSKVYLQEASRQVDQWVAAWERAKASGAELDEGPSIKADDPLNPIVGNLRSIAEQCAERVVPPLQVATGLVSGIIEHKGKSITISDLVGGLRIIQEAERIHLHPAYYEQESVGATMISKVQASIQRVKDFTEYCEQVMAEA